MVTPVNNPALLDWLQRRGAFGGQYGPPNQGTQLASLASPSFQQGNVRRQLLFDAPVSSEAGSDQTRVDNFGDGTNPYSKPGPATLAGGARRWMDKISGKPQYDFLEPSGFGDNPLNRLMDKFGKYSDRRRSNPTGDIAMLLGAGMIPGAGLLTAAAGLFNQLGAHHEYNPARDSNLFYETDRGRMTWDSMDPGGGGEQAGTLNAYNMLMAIAANDPDREIQTQAGWVKVGDLAESMKSGEFYYLGGKGNTETEHTKGLFTEQPTNFAQMSSQYKSGGENMSNEDAVRSLDTRYGDAWNEIAAKAYADGRGYEGAVADAAEAAQELREEGDIASEYSNVLNYDLGDTGLSAFINPGPITLDRAVKEAVEKQSPAIVNSNIVPENIWVNTASSDTVDDAWDSEDFGFSSDEMNFDGII